MNHRIAVISFLALSLFALIRPAGFTDFVSFYAGAQLVGTSRLYSIEAQRQTELKISKDAEVLAAYYIRPPFHAGLMWPLGRLPYPAAKTLWTVILLALFAGFLWLCFPHPDQITIACWFGPVLVSFWLQQDTPFLLVIWAATFRLLEREMPVHAGLLFSLCAVKPHLFLLLPAFVISKRLWRFSGGFIMGAMFLALGCFALQGPDWVSRYWNLILANEAGLASSNVTARGLGIAGLLGEFQQWSLFAAVALSLLAMPIMRTMDTKTCMAFMTAGGVLASPHAFTYDAVLFLPALLIVAEMYPQRALRAGVAVSIACLICLFKPVHWLGQIGLICMFLGFSMFIRKQTERRAEFVV